ncbi:phosphopyruvate hydratase [Caproicibacterium sp. BJN0003]|uniref:phosphopyruvate hydratase n=1 Tax=Caproicibacterium sp. BJN0003 TaxID=2994078 RepID=UPI002257EA33|nr:phosphopyruvate hydratase [Caproicibacterium sp. BJN0003]UZT82934.1 phosphopyruvate hydratase [Caproicibacterium sp. BJN0003]
MKSRITKITARWILDSRGNPTVEATVFLADGTHAKAAVPSGASTGQHEALELRDGGAFFNGMGVKKAVQNIEQELAPALHGMDACDIMSLDAAMCALDGTQNKERLGANAILAVSMAAARAAAVSSGQALWEFLQEEENFTRTKPPVPFLNVLNGGAHAGNKLDTQEFMLVPQGKDFEENLRRSAEVYHALKGILKDRNLSTAVGDEGGFAPELESDEEALDCLTEAVKKAGYEPDKDFQFALDFAASEWADKEGHYLQPKSGHIFTTQELVEYEKKLIQKYPICSLEDPVGEEDWEGWRMITKECGDLVWLVGDDFFVTDSKRLQRGIDEKCANSILIKLNQIGTVTETLNAIRTAQSNQYHVIVSHRSGETADTFIADLAVAVGADALKSGAPCRSERTEKYNRMMEILSPQK